jgi:AcrR family transcriptional regulator
MKNQGKMPDRNPLTKPQAGNQKRSNYHRGNVRRDLITLGWEVLESEGLEAITLRRLTREIGVNPTNFYNHFPNMDYLYAAIQVEGHLEMQECFRKATRKTSNKLEATRALCHEYVFFAIKHPNLYRLMFDHFHDYQTHLDLKDKSDQTMAMVVEILYGENIYDATEPMDFYRTHPLAVTCWSLVHGLSHILIERQIKIRLRSRKQVVEFIDSSLDELIHGIEDQLDS